MRYTRLAVLLVSLLIVGCTGSRSEAPPPVRRDAALAAPTSTTSRTSTSTVATDDRTVSAASSGVAAIAEESCDAAARTFEFPPVDLEAIEYVVPLGLMYGSHVTPVDHQYFQNFLDPTREIEVYSPAAGTITQIQHMDQRVSEDAGIAISDFRLVIDHGCGLSSIFIHIGQLTPEIAAVGPEPGGFVQVSYPVAAGELIGTFRKNVDYNLVDQSVTLEGLLVPEHYRAEPWKIHTPDPFDYFSESIRVDLIAKSLRTAEPIGGQFAYDIDGRLVGNWFVEGTNGYAGNDRSRYWGTHLSFAYDFIDPSHVALSIGTFDGRSEQFGVLGNGPDPAAVAVSSGPVKYELVRYEYWNGAERWDRVSLVKHLQARNSETQVFGVLLVELLSDRRLMVESFPGSRAADVDGFTEAALIYER